MTDLTEQERNDLEDSLSDSTDLLTGDGCTGGEGYASTIARYCDRSDLTAINAYFAACDKAVKEYLDPVIEKCIHREQAERREEAQRSEASMTPEQKAEREQQRVFLDMFMKGELPPLPPYMKLAPTTTVAQSQMQLQRTIPPATHAQNDIAPPPTQRQILMLTVRYHVPQSVINTLNKWTAMRLIAELTERGNL